MKKQLLSILALSTAVSFTNTKGFVEFENKLEGSKTPSEVIAHNLANKKAKDSKSKELAFYTEEKEVTRDLGGKLNVGIFLDKNRDSFLFGGINYKLLDTREINFGHIGARLHTGISENDEIIATLVYKNILDEEHKKSIVKHLLEKGLKKEDLNEYGYRFDDKKETLLGSLLFKGKHDKLGYSYLAAYNSNDFNAGTHKIENDLKVSYDLDKIKLESGLNHKIGNFETEIYKKNGNKYLFDKVTLGKNTLGNLSGYVKVDSDKLTENLINSHKISFDLTTLKKYEHESNKAHTLKLGFENEAKYTKIEGLELKANLNYKNKLGISDDKKNTYIHNPEAIILAKYTKIKDLEILAKVKDGLEITNGLDKTTYLNNFIFDNSYKYTLDKLVAKANLTVENHNEIPKKETDRKYFTTVVGRVGAEYSKELNKLKLSTDTNLAYRFHQLKEDNNHEIFIWTNNNAKYEINENLNLEGNVDFHTYIKPVKAPNNLNLFRANAILSYSKDKIEASTELGNRTYFKVKKALTWEVNSTTNLGYMLDDSLKLNAGLDILFTNKLSRARTLGIEKFVETQGRLEDKFYTWGGFLEKYKVDNKTIEDRIVEEHQNKISIDRNKQLFITPSFGLKKSFLDNKLTLETKGDLTLMFRGQNPEKKSPIRKAKDFGYEGLKGKLTLDVKYAW